MNPITKLLREQKEELGTFLSNTVRGVLADEPTKALKLAVTTWNTTSQQQLIDVIIESTKMLRHELGQQSPEATDKLLESWKEGHTKALHEIITLLEEAKKTYDVPYTGYVSVRDEVKEEA